MSDDFDAYSCSDYHLIASMGLPMIPLELDRISPEDKAALASLDAHCEEFERSNPCPSCVERLAVKNTAPRWVCHAGKGAVVPDRSGAAQGRRALPGIVLGSIFTTELMTGIAAAASGVGVVLRTAITKRAEVRQAEIEAETKRLEITAETERTRIHERAETQRERIRQQTSLPVPPDEV